jgi:hypothetical protein
MPSGSSTAMDRAMISVILDRFGNSRRRMVLNRGSRCWHRASINRAASVTRETQRFIFAGVVEYATVSSANTADIKKQIRERIRRLRGYVRGGELANGGVPRIHRRSACSRGL